MPVPSEAPDGATGYRGFPAVAGRCPGCGNNGTLFVASGGWVTCSLIPCPNPTSWADAMERGAVAVPADREVTDGMIERAAQALADDRNGFTVPPAVVHDGYRATARLALRAALGEPEDKR